MFKEAIYRERAVADYIYKGFKMSYRIIKTSIEPGFCLYKADGDITPLVRRPKSFVPVKFHTEYDTHEGAEYEIKKLLENYVDFELRSFYAMEKEKTK